MEVRKTTVHNLFYSGDKYSLKKTLNHFFENVNIKDKYSNIKAMVSPHAGYIYSGQTASCGYSVLKQNWKTIKQKTIVLLCPSHFEYFEYVAVGLYDELETPLGSIEVDKNLGNKLIKKHPNIFEKDLKASHKEHALETQLPFLKFVAGENNFKVLPLIIGEINPIIVGRILAEELIENELFFIVSSDLSHYKTYTEAKKIDKNTIENFLSKDLNKITSSSQACGIYPWLVINEIAYIKKWTPELLNYTNSGDTTGNKDKVVGYCSMIYK